MLLYLFESFDLRLGRLPHPFRLCKLVLVGVPSPLNDMPNTPLGSV